MTICKQILKPGQHKYTTLVDTHYFPMEFRLFFVQKNEKEIQEMVKLL